VRRQGQRRRCGSLASLVLLPPPLLLNPEANPNLRSCPPSVAAGRPPVAGFAIPRSGSVRPRGVGSSAATGRRLLHQHLPATSHEIRWGRLVSCARPALGALKRGRAALAVPSSSPPCCRRIQWGQLLCLSPVGASCLLVVAGFGGHLPTFMGGPPQLSSLAGRPPSPRDLAVVGSVPPSVAGEPCCIANHRLRIWVSPPARRPTVISVASRLQLGGSLLRVPRALGVRHRRCCLLWLRHLCRRRALLRLLCDHGAVGLVVVLLGLRAPSHSVLGSSQVCASTRAFDVRFRCLSASLDGG
jgi:hypothetical protein